MAERRTVHLSEQSLRDLLHVADYTLDRWGEIQHSTYLELSDSALGRLGEFPEVGRQRDELGDGVRSFACGRHIIYYLASDQAILVARIQHHAAEPVLED